MKTHEAYRKARLKDFLSRKNYAPEDVLIEKKYGWEYIAVHPMSDDFSLLKKLNFASKQCTKVDCYWKVEEDVMFLQVVSKSGMPNHPLGFYARVPQNRKIPILYLTAVLEVDAVSRLDIESAMEKIYLSGIHQTPFSALSDSLKLIQS